MVVYPFAGFLSVRGTSHAHAGVVKDHPRLSPPASSVTFRTPANSTSEIAFLLDLGGKNVTGLADLFDFDQSQRPGLGKPERIQRRSHGLFPCLLHFLSCHPLFIPLFLFHLF